MKVVLWYHHKKKNHIQTSSMCSENCFGECRILTSEWGELPWIQSTFPTDCFGPCNYETSCKMKKKVWSYVFNPNMLDCYYLLVCLFNHVNDRKAKWKKITQKALWNRIWISVTSNAWLYKLSLSHKYAKHLLAIRYHSDFADHVKILLFISH